VERTLIALGLVLALAGVIVASNGYIYVNVDRGPPLMVSGVLAFGFGLVLGALGFILRELQAIAADASKAALLLAKGRVAATPAEPAVKPAPARQAPPPPPAPTYAPPPPAPPPPLAPFEPVAAAPASEQAALADTFVNTAASDLFFPAAEPESKSVAPPPPVLPEAESGKPAAPARPPLSWVVQPASAEPPVEASQPGDWLNRALADGADKVHKAAPPAKLSRPRVPPLEPALSTGPRREDEKADDQPKPDAIGHYEANGAHYTMFSDGSIEAETQHGVYRFGSIEELKHFIEGDEAGDLAAKS